MLASTFGLLTGKRASSGPHAHYRRLEPSTQVAAGQTLDSIRQQLAAAGHGAAVLRRVKLAEYRREQLLEVSISV